jgi:hypothetical protein
MANLCTHCGEGLDECDDDDFCLECGYPHFHEENKNITGSGDFHD